LGLGLIAIAGPLLAYLDVPLVAHPLLQELSLTTLETPVLAHWEGLAVVTVDQIASQRTIHHTSPLGAQYASTGSATVQTFLADMSPETAEHLINSGQVQLQPGWTMAEVRQRLNTVHQRGYAVNLQETFDD